MSEQTINPTGSNPPGIPQQSSDGLKVIPEDVVLRQDVVAAVALGWATATLYRVCGQQMPAKPTDRDYLPKDAELMPDEAAQRYVARMRAGIGKLTPRFGGRPAAGASQIAEGLVLTLQEGQSNAAVQSDLWRLHLQVLSGLAAADPRLGKSYALGAILAGMADRLGQQPATCEPAARRGARRGYVGPRRGPEPVLVKDEELLTVHDHVRDLATVLPPHAGQAVRESMARWITYLETEKSRQKLPVPHKDRRLLLQRQIFLWKALLVGEKDAQDSLAPKQFLQVQLSTMRTVRQQALSALKAVGWPAWLLLTGVLGVVVLALVLTKGSTATALTAIPTTLTAGLAALWRLTGPRLAGNATHYADRILDAQLDSAIARAVTILPADADEKVIDVEAGTRVLVPVRSSTAGSDVVDRTRNRETV